MIAMFQTVVEPVMIALVIVVCLAVPKVWVQTILNKRDIDNHNEKINVIFHIIDTISTDV